LAQALLLLLLLLLLMCAELRQTNSTWTDGT
jgi:hypothetical protein